MIAEVIENSLRSIEPQNTTDIFIIVNIGFFLLSLYWTKKILITALQNMHLLF